MPVRKQKGLATPKTYAKGKVIQKDEVINFSDALSDEEFFARWLVGTMLPFDPRKHAHYHVSYALWFSPLGGSTDAPDSGTAHGQLLYLPSGWSTTWCRA